MRKNGFTLIELMIVVAIIGILASLAIPDFMKMIGKAKQSEAQTNLNAIYTMQISYFADNGTYAGKTTSKGDAFQMIGWYPKSPKALQYAYVLDEAVMTGPKVAVPAGDIPSGFGSTRSSFTAIAIANIDNDKGYDIWITNDANDLENISDDIASGGY